MKVTQSPPGVFLLTDGGEGEAPVMVVKAVGGGLGTGVVYIRDNFNLTSSLKLTDNNRV